MATRLTPKTVASEPPPKKQVARAKPALEADRIHAPGGLAQLARGLLDEALEPGRVE